MFTGLVEGLGRVSELRPEGDRALRIVIKIPPQMAGGCTLGESVAINGCCLTVVEFTETDWHFQAGQETLSRTNLGTLKPDDCVNLERSLLPDSRLGGHFVQGHVDGLATIAAIDRDGEWVNMAFEVSSELTRLMVGKGSVAVDGISLTLVEVTNTRFSVALIPHTLEVTTLGTRTVGETVNIEADMLGKYVVKLLGQMNINRQESSSET